MRNHPGLRTARISSKGRSAPVATTTNQGAHHRPARKASPSTVESAATAIVLTGTTGHVKLAAAGALADAALSTVEGLALRAGRWWAPWLVVVATGALLPLELILAVRKPGGLRIGLLAVNLAVVVYLLE